MIHITPHPEGCLLAVRAQSVAQRNGIMGEQAGCLKVAVTASPDKGRANQAIVEVLVDGLDVKRSQIELVGGATSRLKSFLIRGLSVEELRAKLQSLLAGSTR